MEETYLINKTKYLTNHGLKYSYDICKDDKLLVLDKRYNLVKSSNYAVNYQDFKYGCDNSFNTYSKCISNSPTYFSSFVKSNNLCCNNITQKFYIRHEANEDWYDLPLEYLLVLSLVITNSFTLLDDGSISRKENISNKDIFYTFKKFNDNFKIYFPYNVSLKTYNFVTNLYLSHDRLVQKLVENINLRYKIVDILIKYNIAKGYNFRSLRFSSYNIACIIQVYFSLCGYFTKLKKENDIYKLTIVKNNDVSFADRDASKDINYSSNVTMNNIEIKDIYDGKLIISQDINDITYVSILSLKSYNTNIDYNESDDE